MQELKINLPANAFNQTHDSSGIQSPKSFGKVGKLFGKLAAIIAADSTNISKVFLFVSSEDATDIDSRSFTTDGSRKF